MSISTYVPFSEKKKEKKKEFSAQEQNPAQKNGSVRIRLNLRTLSKKNHGRKEKKPPCNTRFTGSKIRLKSFNASARKRFPVYIDAREQTPLLLHLVTETEAEGHAHVAFVLGHDLESSGASVELLVLVAAHSDLVLAGDDVLGDGHVVVAACERKR